MNMADTFKPEFNTLYDFDVWAQETKYTGKHADSRGDVHHYKDGQWMGADTKPPVVPAGETCDFSCIHMDFCEAEAAQSVGAECSPHSSNQEISGDNGSNLQRIRGDEATQGEQGGAE
jgi:hypothetical protein